MLSEDDLRVEGISKRYSLQDVWHWGLLYVIDPVFEAGGAIDLEASTVCELVFLDDSRPLTWVLNLRRKADHRDSHHEYDIP
jgi:hypothetical protein